MASKFGKGGQIRSAWKDYRTIYAVSSQREIVKVGCTGSMNSRFYSTGGES